jgi:hypothetical protein
VQCHVGDLIHYFVLQLINAIVDRSVHNMILSNSHVHLSMQMLISSTVSWIDPLALVVKNMWVIRRLQIVNSNVSKMLMKP